METKNMEKKTKIVVPRYQQVAADVASRIVDKEYHVGDKIHARSSLASYYGVSAETARRAISVLADMNIVEVTKGSGAVVTSHENAVNFISQYQDIQSVTHLKREIVEILERQSEDTKNLKDSIGKLMDRTERFRSVNPFTPFEIQIEERVWAIGKTIAEVNFWHNTTATVIALRRDENLLLSPGPYSVLMAGDILYFIGEEKCYDRVKQFLYPHEA